MVALPLAAFLGVWSPAVPAASSVANLSVSVVVPRSCAIDLGQARAAQPRALCRPGSIDAGLAASDTRGLQYNGPIDPVSVVRLRGTGNVPDTWVVTF